MKRIIFILFFILTGAWLYADAWWVEMSPNAIAQGKRPAPSTRINYSKFKHSSHAGAIKATRKGGVQQLDCAYCHGSLTKDNPDTLKGYPYQKNGLKSDLTHPACADCHAITGSEAKASGTYPAMCLICHQSVAASEMSKNLRSFPNSAVEKSQFFDRYSHLEHVSHFNKASDAFKERFKDKEKFKEKDHFECAACHLTNQDNMVMAQTQFIPGAKQSLPGHPQCFVCHFNEQEVPKEKPSFATNCVGCHAIKAEMAGKGSELAVNFFTRQIINTQLKPQKPDNPDDKASGPFSHKSHLADEDDKSAQQCFECRTAECLKCHGTGKKAEKLSDFFLEDEKKEKQPRAANCLRCHYEDMEQKIEGTVKLETAKCSYCHSLQTIKERAVSGLPLPPPNHFRKRAATPTPTPK